MWHEARRQERKIRGMLVDYRRRAERRRDFYEKIKADPTQFLQVHGRQCKIHLDPNIAAAADSAVMMPWQGQTDNLIDRFDVRAHLDYIPPIKKEEETELSQDERQLNYERYRIIAQNSFLSISEEKFLKQLHLEEQFGYTETKGKKEPKTGGVAIGFNYDDGTGISQAPSQDDDDSEGNSDSDLDVDLAINVSKMDSAQAHEMNKHGRNFGMSSNDFYSFLTNDLEEAETFRLAKEEEHEKALFSGRKSRRERRAHREKRLANRVISPPSYAAQASPTLPKFRDSKSRSHSKSPTPENTGKITYITSFGDDDEAPSSSKPTYADKVKSGKPKIKKENSSERIVSYGKKISRSKSRERNYGKRKIGSTSRSRKSRSRSRSRGRRTRSRSRGRRSRSRSRGRRTRSRSRGRATRSRSRGRATRSRSRCKRSRSKSRDRHKRSHSKSRSRGRSYRNRRSTSQSSSSSNSDRSKSYQKLLSPKQTALVSRSKSPIPQNQSPSRKAESPPKVLPRYYGRKKSDQSSSEFSDSDNMGDVEMKPAYNPVASDTKSGHGNNSGTAIKKTSTNLTIAERLKRKRQAQLLRQYKADKIAELLKTEREKQEQQTREDELREMAIKLRRRQREKRHAYDSNRSSSSSDSDSSSKSKESVPEKGDSPSELSREREREKEVKPPKRYDSHYNRDRRDSSDRRGHSRERERREGDRDNRRDNRDKRERRSSSLSRRVVYRENERDRDRRDRWRDDRDRKDFRTSRSLVDY